MFFSREASLRAAVAASNAGAQALMSRFMSGPRELETWEKSPGALVTQADMESDRAIAAALQRFGAPGVIISEESSGILGDARDAASMQCEWLIDPLCGTVPFSTGMSHWGINIALRRAGELDAAVLSTPVSGHMLSTLKGEGLSADSGSGEFVTRVPESTLREVTIGLEIDGPSQWRSMIDSGHLKWVARAGQINAFSSAAYPMMQLCLGRLHGVAFYSIDPVHVAAGALIATELGASFTDGDGVPIDWSQDDTIPIAVAAWHGVHAELISAIQEFRG